MKDRWHYRLFRGMILLLNKWKTRRKLGDKKKERTLTPSFLLDRASSSILSDLGDRWKTQKIFSFRDPPATSTMICIWISIIRIQMVRNSNISRRIKIDFFLFSNYFAGYNAVFDCRNYAFFTKDTVMLPFKCLESEEYDYEDHKSRLSPDPPIIITDLESNIRVYTYWILITYWLTADEIFF